MKGIFSPSDLDQLLLQSSRDPQGTLNTLRGHLQPLHSIEYKNKINTIHGLALANLWKYDAAEKILNRTAKSLSKLGMTFGLALVLDELAAIYLIRGDINQAMMTWLNCLRFGIQHKDHTAIMRAHLGIGKTYYGIYDFNNAKRHHLAAIDVACMQPENPLSCEAYVCLGVDLIKLAQFESAYATLSIAKSLLYCTQYPNRSGCEIEIYFGMTLAAQDQINLAIDKFNSAIELATQDHYSWGLALAHLEKAKSLLTIKNHQQAIDELSKAEHYADLINSSLFRYQCYEMQYQIFKDTGDYELALERMQLFTQSALHKLDRDQKIRPSSTVIKLLNRLQEQLNFEHSKMENTELASRLKNHQALIRQLTERAETDPLTGLFNRRALDHRLEREIELSDIQQQPFSLLMLDIDHFKSINDVHSHQIGDKVLIQIALIIVSTCRQGEFVARYGGEEFTVLLPSATLEAACNVAERIRLNIAEFDWSSIKKGLNPITVSIGASCRQTAEAAESLLSRADALLYQAKHAGRNRVLGDHPQATTPH
ncbi:GGDEF domain-containing protein [Chitinibacter bivalviorum]|uniref:diguanylate cyclase n=1 Tax=Chitinibacter bivalviorum TaxID=2739434 RepID=A0A7H9BH95_9NEIS|nr:GGDEF domain-containing protein [Chitinibacter bivalviorum]QLG88100.1 GGDEF domain-containing protein [Chitinibacter bivalviorum]